MEAIRVLVCGSNYGRLYLRAIDDSAGRYAFAGLLAQGSPRSVEIAESAGVPLITRGQDIPENIDMACVAVPLAASDLVLELLERRVPVLCEHPQPAELIQRASVLAERSSVPFHINAHFADLAAPRHFIEFCRRHGRPTFVKVMTSDRALYAVLDVLMQSLDGLAPMKVLSVSKRALFNGIELKLGDTSATLQLQPSIREGGEPLEDGSEKYLVTFRIDAVFEDGVLGLGAVAGPVLWNANEATVEDGDQGLHAEVYAQPTSLRSLAGQRIAANLASMDVLLAQIEGGPVPSCQTRDYLLGVSRCWDQLSAALEG